MILSVHKKASRLAVLGELNRYPVLIKALAQSIKYEPVLNSSADPDSLIALALAEIKGTEGGGSECWLSKRKKIKSLIGFRDSPRHIKPNVFGKKTLRFLESKFERFWLQQINETKLGSDGLDHNKLRLYKQLKGSFKTEPYIDMVNNRNQRCSLSRMRISAHHLHIETGRYSRPKPTPIIDRTCKYCSEGVLDDESHFLLTCRTFENKRLCFFKRLTTILPNFIDLPNNHKLATILCPASPTAAKLSNKFIDILFCNRKKLDEGTPLNNLTFPPQLENYCDDFNTSVVSSVGCSESSAEEGDSSNSSINLET